MREVESLGIGKCKKKYHEPRREIWLVAMDDIIFSLEGFGAKVERSTRGHDEG